MKQTPFARLLALSVYATALAVGAPGALAQTVQSPATHPYTQSQPIPGRYIVVFWDNVNNPAAEAANLLRASGGQLHHTYSSALKGFAASLPDAALQGIRNNPNVNYIEQDQTVSLNTTQAGATWGLDRIDQHALDLNSSYQYNYTGAANGEPSSPAVNAFIIDTGIHATHGDFNGRVNVGAGFNAINDGNGTNDCNGHGTHVAGTVGGTTWGVAKGVTLIPVRVLNCQGSGSWSGVIAGIDWAANSALRPAVANMSLGGGASQAVDDAVAGAVSKGVTMVVAAGNSNANACNYSPARAPSAITVGATTSSDARASYSNYGTCLDLFAPGSGITSAWNTSDTASNTISGTSMASPHVAGVAALALAANMAASPWAVADFLTTNNNATSSVVGSAGSGSPNKLVYSLAAGAPQEPMGQTVAVKFVGSGADIYKNGWRAWVTVTIGVPPDWTAAAGEATVVGSFSPGGTARCTVTGGGNCKLTSVTIKNNIPLTKFTLKGVSGLLMNYDASKNSEIAPEISISK